MSVRAKTAENTLILVGLQWANRAFSVITKVILARLLFPEDFGIFALAIGLVGLVASFGNFGLDYAIIQRGRNANKIDYDVAMSIRLVISCVLLIITVIAARPWADLFHEPLVSGSTQLLAIVYVISAWAFVPGTKLSAALEYRRLILPNVMMQLANSVVAITLAVLGFRLWALVIAAIAAPAVEAIVFFAISPWSFHLRFDRSVAKPLLGYARFLFVVSILSFLITNVDNFAVGYYLGAEILGFYVLAYSLCLFSSMVSGSAASALFPSLVGLQHDPGRLRRGYMESLGYAAATVAPAGIGISIFAREIISIVFGARWLPSAAPLFVLAFYGMARALSDFSDSLFAATGQPKVIAERNALILILSALLLVPLTQIWGTLGAATAMTVPVLAALILSIVRTSSLVRARPVELAERIAKPFLAAAVMGIFLIGLRVAIGSLVGTASGLDSATEQTIELILLVPAGCLIYFLILHAVGKEIAQGLVRNLRLALGRSAEN